MGEAVRKNTWFDGVVRKVALREQQPEAALEMMRLYNLSAIAARILAARGLKANDELQHFLDPTLQKGLPDPDGLKGLPQACEIILQHIAENLPIAICCDFDVDGLSGGAQVFDFLRRQGALVKVFVPDRFSDGYGLNERTVQLIAENGFKLIICVDFGSTNMIELSLARSLGLKTIVVDHHHVYHPELPCDVFINPQQAACRFADGLLCASGLAWYLVAGLKKRLRKQSDVDPRSYLDLACLGTVCDMVPLRGVNRVLAKRGLQTLSETTRVGLQALKRIAGINKAVTCYDVSFAIGPRLNAAGRMVHGEVVIDLLTTTDCDFADKLARKLHRLNAERQEIELQVKEEAVRQVQEQVMESGEGLPSALVAWNEKFHTGVIGIVAQRLVEMFYRPAAVLGFDKDGIFKGSVRGVKGVSVVETLAEVKEYLIKFGGHEGAGGFSIEERKIPSFKKAFNEACARKTAGADLFPTVDADTEVNIGDVTVSLIKELQSFSPFGIGNPGPQLLLRNLLVKEVKVLKDAHLKVIFSDQKNTITGLLWRRKSHPSLVVGNKVDIVGKADTNTYGGANTIQISLSAAEDSGNS